MKRDVSRGFIPAACLILPDYPIRPHDEQGIHPFGRDVYVAIWCRRTAKKHVLQCDEGAVVFSDFVELLAHYSTVTDLARLRG